MVAQPATAAAADISAAAADAASDPRLPWYRRYTRWRQTSRAEAVAAESSLLSLSGAKLEAADVPVGPRQDEFMNTVVGGPADAPALVMIPGYGAGIGFFFRNLAALTQEFRVHAVDLLGTGMSGRPPFRAKDRAGAEAFFLESLAKWRQQMGIDKMVLVGHSLGGYLSARYALANPDHVEHLILVCPAGVTKLPEDWQPPARFQNRWSVAGQIYRTASTAWDAGVTPGGVIRTLGPWGRSLISGYVRNRFSRDGAGLSDTEASAFEQYFYHITASRGSGEHALRHLLGPYAWARAPLEDDLKDIKVPVTFMYGDHDWMDPAGAHRAAAGMVERRAAAGPGDQQVITVKVGMQSAHCFQSLMAGPGDQRVITVKDAGHYAFLDQPQVFLDTLHHICTNYLRSGTPQVPDEQPVSASRFPDDAKNHRHFPGGPVRATDAAVAKDGSMQNGAAHMSMQNRTTAGTPPGSPKVKQRRSSSTEAAEAVMQRTEL